MEKICFSCGRKVHHQYCPYCGQKTSVERLTWKNFTFEIFQFFTHIESTFFQTSRLLLTSPGLVFQEWLAGKRKKYYKPVSFFLTWTTIELLVSRMIINLFNYQPVVRSVVNTKDPDILMASLQHSQLFYLLCLPLSAVLGYFLLGRKKFYVFETFVIAFFIYGYVFCLWTFFQLIAGTLLHINTLCWQYYLFQMGLSIAYTFWSLFNLLHKSSLHHLFPRLLAFVTINIFLTAKIFFYLGYIWVQMYTRLPGWF